MARFISKKISSEEMTILDNNAEWLGIPKSHLMEVAGYTFTTEIMNQGYLGKNSKIAIFCGTGNNGGDGFVIARHLASFGRKILVILLGTPENIRTNEAKLNWNIISQNLNYSIKIEIIKDSSELKRIENIFENEKAYELIIDGLLGTGIKGTIREPISSAIDLINKLKEKDKDNVHVASIDIPSGLDPDTGTVSDKVINADLVITFHRTKIGMSGKNKYIKKLIERSIGIPLEASLFVGKGDLIPTLKTRKTDNYKGQFGKVLVIGGSLNYSGAPAYSSLAAIHFGCDLVITYVPEVVGNVIRTYSPNLIVRTSPGNWLTIEALDELKWLIDWSNAVIIGPGLGLEKETEEVLVKLLEALKEGQKSFVLDADALKLVKNHLALIKGQNVILTPHAGELKVMTDVDLPPFDKIDERGDLIFNLAKKLDVTLLVKGPYDYVSNGKIVRVNKTGVPEMSIGGTGDCLAGLCGSFLTTENPVFQSACSAAFLNGYLGEFCKKKIGPRFTTMDMIGNINTAILNLLNT
jgi:NAD(P)H-hydrate epimerase